MRKRTPIRVLLVAALTLALLPMLSTFAPGGQVAGFTTASPAVADQIWYQSVGRAGTTAACQASTATDLAVGWTNWEPSWDTWVNSGRGGFVCNRQITWAFDSVPPSSSGSSSVVTCATGGGAAGTCVLGSTGPGGGKVFYVDESAATGSRYLEAAPNTWGGGVPDPALVWSGNTDTDVVTQTDIGTGSANTTAIIAQSATAGRAATAARAYTGGGLNDWFLPSKDELNQLYTQKDVVGGFADVGYWSSSQYNALSAWLQSFFVDGGQADAAKVVSSRVRPVRAF